MNSGGYYLARAREIFVLRVHGCHIADKHRACTLPRRVSRVPQGCYVFDKFSREFSAKYHRKECKLSSEATNSLENLFQANTKTPLELVRLFPKGLKKDTKIINPPKRSFKQKWFFVNLVEK